MTIPAKQPRTKPAPIRVGGVAGVILAGGQGRRLFEDRGGEKALAVLAGKTLIAHVAARFAPQVSACIVNANSRAPGLRAAGLKLVADGSGEFLGPLAGILAGMQWARSDAPYCAWLASVPVDAPFVPLDLVARLAGQIQADEHAVVVLRRGGRIHFATALWSLHLVEALARALKGGTRKIEDFLASQHTGYLDWPARGADPFLNINTPADLRRAERRAKALRAPRPAAAKPRRR